jgi:hypothetical protein
MPSFWHASERGERLQVSVQQVAIYQAGGPASEPFLIPEWIRRDRNASEGKDSRQRKRENAVRPAVQQRLLVAVRETHDEEADRLRLSNLMTTLVDFPGGDEVRLIVYMRDGQRVELALPAVRACDELCLRVSQLVGEWGEVRLEGAATEAVPPVT